MYNTDGIFPLQRSRKAVLVAPIRLTDEQAAALYNSRGDLWLETFTLVRMRVAIRIIERIYKLKYRGTDKYYYIAEIMKTLEKRRAKGDSHMLHFELIAVLKEIQRGHRREMIYANLRHVRAKRAIHKVMHGGRKDQR